MGLGYRFWWGKTSARKHKSRKHRLTHTHVHVKKTKNEHLKRVDQPKGPLR